MDYRILGRLEVYDDGRDVALGDEKPRALLAILLLHRNEVVSADRLMDELWGESPPASALRTLQAYVSRLRKALSDGNGGPSGSNGGVLLTEGRGYLLRIASGELDLDRFSDIAERGRDALAAGNPQEAAERLRDALELWRGPPLANFAYEPFAQEAVLPCFQPRAGIRSNVLDEQQSPAGGEDPTDLSERRAGIGHGAEHHRRDDRVERTILERQLLSRCRDDRPQR